MAETKKTVTKSEKSGAVFDVAKPGKSVPSSSAKPIIVTNRPVLKDPMVVEEDGEVSASAADSESARSPSLPSAKVHIEPLSSQKSDADDASAPPPEESDKAEEPAAEGGDEVKKDEKTTAEPDLSEVDDGAAEPSAKNIAKKAEEDEEAELKKAAERAEELDKLAESRKFYLPINQVEKRRTKRYVLLGVVFIVILGLAWADVALDAGIITIPGVKAPTHFFK